jgi:imidazole glycerol-phosphate synthase subunit HisH
MSLSRESPKTLAVVNHGIGNIQSVLNALDYLGHKSHLAETVSQVDNSDVVILPGVGNFGSVMNAIRAKGLFEVIDQKLRENSPLIGICVGMQVLLAGSTESPDNPGFGFFEGNLEHLSSLESSAVIPSIGWNNLYYSNSDKPNYRLKEAYFVHSYFASEVGVDDVVSTYSWQGHNIPSHMSSGRVHGVQFHPEKSRIDGIMFIDELITEVTS